MSSSGTTTLDTAGTYCEDDITVTYDKVQGSATTPPTTIGIPLTVSVNSDGLVNANYETSVSITPTVVPGYISTGTAGRITTICSGSLQLNSLAASTWTPTTTSQIISSGTYLTGDQTIAGDSNLLASNIASGVSIFGVNGTFQGGGDLGSIIIKPENCVSSSTQITPETYICETDSSYPGTVISYNDTNQNDIGDPLPNSIKIELNKTYHCNGQLFIKWDNDNTEEYYYIDSNFKITSYTSLVSLPFTWEGSTGAVQTFNYIYIKMNSYQPYGYQTIIRMATLGTINKSGVLLPDSFYRIIQPEVDGYETINLDFNSDPRFLNIYKSLAYRSTIYSSAQYVSEWCNSLSSIISYQFNCVRLGGTFNFNNVSKINQYAFAEPDAGQGMVGSPSYIFNFPSLTSLSFAAFYYNRAIRGFYANQLSVIESKAFQYCAFLSIISFPECTLIKNNAFYYCSNLTTASFSVCTSIGDSAFYSCFGLTTISFPECTYIGYGAFCMCSGLTTISFPECSYIGNSAFQSCYNLTTVSFPECTYIGSSAFSSCSSLTAISFPECTYIGYGAFQNCNNLTTVSFPKCTSIGGSAFSGCISLNIVSFPECTYIGSSAFSSCSSLTAISFPKCTSMGGSAFYSCINLTTISFPVCTYIGANAFRYCSQLQEAQFPECTLLSGQYIFGNCSSLSIISFPKVSSISAYVFQSCFKLESAYFMGSSIPNIGAGIFGSTPMALSSYLGYFGSIYVPASLLANYKTATNWVIYSNRMVGI